MLLIQLIKLLFTDPLQFLLAVLILFVPLLISITVHEWAHGFVAYKFGDPTPKMQGRLSLNPFAHLDPVGTLMLFIIGIGWAKPVEINSENISPDFKRFKLMLVALAGPFSNFMLGTFFTVLLYFFGGNPFLAFILILLTRINFVLGLFNLILLPPLDGANILYNLLPEKIAAQYFKIAPYSIPVLLILIFTGAIDVVFNTAGKVQETLFRVIEFFFEHYA